MVNRKEEERQPKEWTVMVYLAGDNNLSAEMIYAIKEMYRVGVTQDLDIVIQFDPSAIGAQVRRYVISREELAEKIKIRQIASAISGHQARAIAASASRDPLFPHKRGSDTNQFHVRRIDAIASLDIDGHLEELQIGENSIDKGQNLERPTSENSANPQELKNFIYYSMTKHPSKHYMLVLSGHGSGVDGDFLPDDNPGDPTALPSSLSIPGLRKVLGTVLGEVREFFVRDGHYTFGKQVGIRDKIDILGMDSCLMSMAEVGFEVRESVAYLVGSEGFELNTGWPYHRILEAMNQKLRRGEASPLNLAPDVLAKIIVKNHTDYYTDYQLTGSSTDLSACDLGKEEMDLLATSVGGLAGTFTKGLDDPAIKDAIVLAHWDAQSYKNDQYVDLWDFCSRLQLYCIRQPIVMKALQKKPELNHTLNALQKSDDSEALQTVVKAVIELKDATLNDLKNVIENCEKVKEAINNKTGRHVVLKSCYSGAAFQHSHGISVYFPWSESEFFRIKPEGSEPGYSEESVTSEKSKPISRYESLSFVQASSVKADGKDIGWADFLRQYLDKTRRKRRDQAKHLDTDKILRFGAPNPSVLFVRGTSTNLARGTSTNLARTNSETGSMKNPPDGFYPSKC
jgi:hypothetical protein